MTCLAKFNPVDVFDSFFADAVPAASGKSACWSPRADVVLGADKATIRFDLPGMKKEDSGLKVDDGVLTVTGSRATETERKEDQYWLRECRSGAFERSFRLGEEFDPARITANYENGVLTVSIAKREKKETSQQIAIG